MGGPPQKDYSVIRLVADRHFTTLWECPGMESSLNLINELRFEVLSVQACHVCELDLDSTLIVTRKRR